MLEVAEREVMESSVARVHAMGLFWVPLVFSCESGSVRRAWDTGIGGRSRDPGVGRPRPGPREHAALSYEGCP